MKCIVRALRDFVRGFVGLAELGRDPAGVQRALEQRAAGRRSCC